MDVRPKILRGKDKFDGQNIFCPLFIGIEECRDEMVGLAPDFNEK